PDAFRTISEVADDLDVPQHVLRFWETRFAQIKPMKRSGGRRYYRRDDVELLRGIRHLLYGQGYTIRGVQRILREQGVKAVQGFSGGVALRQAPAPDAPALGANDRAGAVDDLEAEGTPLRVAETPVVSPSPRSPVVATVDAAPRAPVAQSAPHVVTQLSA